uniref:ClpX-type ZB domain-containing protein n=1 Tax=viral metagenome TaxID=1070528 RepID=A0A6M3LH09_9ZZZZ
MKCNLCSTENNIVSGKTALGNKVYLCTDCVEKLRKLGKIKS